MGRPKKRKGNRSPAAPSRKEAGEQGAAPSGADRSHSNALAGQQAPVFRFVILLGVLVAAFNALFYLWISKTAFFDTYLHLNARLTAAIINLFGDNATASGTLLFSPRYSMEVKRGCDALQATGFFVLAVLTSPVPLTWTKRIPALLLGTAVLLVLNLVRLISLYYTGVYYPDAFDMMHVEVWQAVFIFLPLALWLYWGRRALRPRPAEADVHADE